MKNILLKSKHTEPTGERSPSTLSSCLSLILICFSLIGSSLGQSVGAAIRSIEAQHSIVSLAPSPRPAAAIVARRSTDSKFENVPANYRVFPAASIGEFTGAEVLTLEFAGETTVREIKSTNKDFVIEPGGTCLAGMNYTRGGSCLLIVRFTPQGPGHRLGFIKITHSVEVEPAYVGLTGNGYAPVVSFTPSLMGTLAATVSGGAGIISNSTNLAVAGDVIYVADTGNNFIRELDSTGIIANLQPVFATPAAVTVDSSGFIYSTNVSGSTYYFSFYAPWGSQSAFGTTHTVGSCTPSTPCPLTSVGMANPANITIDPYDNLFMEDATKGAIEMPVASLAGGSGSLNLWYLTDQFVYASGNPTSFAADANDNIYNFYNYGTTTCYLQEEPLYNAEYAPTSKKVAGGVKCGFSGDGGQARSAEISSSIGQMAFDTAGNLYFADTGNQRIRRIDAATGIIRTIAGTGTAGSTGDNGPATSAAINTPTGVGVDSQGQVYILSKSSTTGQVVRKVGITGALTFPSTKNGVASTALLLNVANTGNSALTFLRDTISGVNITDFTIDPNTTNCNFATGNSLAAGQSCQIGLIFKPGAVGARMATLNLIDNTLSGVNKVSLKGTGVAAATVNFTAPTAAQIAAGTKVNATVKVTSAYSMPTGKVTFTIDGKAAGSATLKSGAASIAVASLALGNHQLVATYGGDQQHATAKASKTLTVK